MNISDKEESHDPHERKSKVRFEKKSRSEKENSEPQTSQGTTDHIMLVDKCQNVAGRINGESFANATYTK